MEYLLLSPSQTHNRGRQTVPSYYAANINQDHYLPSPRAAEPIFYTKSSTSINSGKSSMSWRHDVAWQPDGQHWSICFATHWLMAGMLNILGSALCIASWYMLWRARNPCEYYDGLIGGSIVVIATLYGIIITILPKTGSRDRRRLVLTGVILSAASSACALAMTCASFVKLFALPACLVTIPVALNSTTTTTTVDPLSSTVSIPSALVADLAVFTESPIVVTTRSTPISVDYANPLLWQYGMMSGSLLTLVGTLLCTAASVTEHISTRLLVRVQKVVDRSLSSKNRPIRDASRLSVVASDGNVSLSPRVSAAQLLPATTSMRNNSLRQSSELQRQLILQQVAARKSRDEALAGVVRTSDVVIKSPTRAANRVSTAEQRESIARSTKERYSGRRPTLEIQTQKTAALDEPQRTSHRHHRRHHRRHHHRADEGKDKNDTRNSGRKSRDDDETDEVSESESDISSIGPEVVRPSAPTAAALAAPISTARTVTTTIQRKSNEPVAATSSSATGAARLSLPIPRALLQPPVATAPPGGRTIRESFTSRLSYQK